MKILRFFGNMGVIIRQSIKSTAASYAGVVIGALNTIFLMPAVLSVSEVGLVRTIIDSSFLLATYARFGIPNAAVKFFPYFKEQKKYNGLLGMMMLTLSLAFLLIFLITWAFEDAILGRFIEKSPEVIGYFYHVIIIAFLYTLVFGLQTYSSLMLRIVVPKIIMEVILRLGLLIALILYHLDQVSFTQMIDVVIASYVFCVFLMIFYIIRLRQFHLRFSTKHLGKDLIKNIAIYSGFMFMASGGGIIVSKIDILMITSMKGTDFTGVYGIAFFIATLVEMPKRSLIQISSPIIAQHFKEGKIEEIDSIYKKSSTNLLIAGGLVSLLIWLNINEIFTLIPQSDVFSAGKYVVLFIALSKLIDMGMGVNAEIMGNSSFYRWNVIIMPVFALAVVVSNLIFIPLYGINGAAVASLISVMAYNLFRMVLVWVKIGVQPFSMGTLKSLLVITLSFFAGFYCIIPTDSAILSIGIKSTQTLIAFGLFTLWLRPSDDIDQVISYIRNTLSRK